MVSRREEDYLEAIKRIVDGKGYAKVNDIVKALDLSPSSVTEMFQKLGREGYVNYEKHGAVTLTTRGEEIAAETDRRHEILREFLQVLGVDGEVADAEACEMEHSVSTGTIDRIEQLLLFIKDRGVKDGWLSDLDSMHLEHE